MVDQGQVWPECWMVIGIRWRSRMMEHGHKIYVDGGLLSQTVLPLAPQPTLGVLIVLL